MAKDPLNTLGASNHSLKDRSELDYYGTDPRTTKALLNAETFNKKIWEPCSGHGLIVNELKQHGYIVRSSDINDYGGYPEELIDFLSYNESWDGDIITNPPYGLAGDFVVKALGIVEPRCKVAMLLRLQFLEGQKRYSKIFKSNPPKIIYVFVDRQVCSKVDDFNEGSAVAYCWMIWEKGFTGNPIIKWLSTR